MKHKNSINPLELKQSHRISLIRNMVTSLFMHERVKTTKTKAKVVQRVAEKMLTRAKNDSLHNRRIIAKDIKNKAILNKLFKDIAPRSMTRPGGYTRIYKLGQRVGDAAEMVLLELVDRTDAVSE